MSRTLKQLVRQDGITAESKRVGDVPPDKGYPAGSSAWKVTLKRPARGGRGAAQLTVDFFMGPALTEDPTAEGVLDCLLSDASCGDQSFQEYCDEFGYDTDSRKAYATWQACVRTVPKVKQFLGLVLYAQYRSAEH